MNMKKIAAAAAAAVLALGVFTAFPESPAVISVSAEDSNSYTTDDGIIISTDKNGDKYVSGFSNKIKKKNISIPNGIKYIDFGAFFKAEHIESVTIPSSVTEIKSAFRRCINLKTVTFEQGSKLTFIADSAFSGCLKLTSINLPSSLKEMGQLVFANCENLTSLTVPAETKLYGLEHNNSWFAGYMYGETATGDPEGTYKADGKTTVYPLWDEDTVAVTQKPITLYVTKGSDAEKYAKVNGIAYKYNKASTSSAKPSSPQKLTAPTGIKGTVAENRIVLTWNKVSGAKAYRVYKYDPKTGKYLKYKDVGGEKCTVKGLKAGTKYSFKVYTLTSEKGKFVPQNPSKAVSFTTKDKEEFNDELITL